MQANKRFFAELSRRNRYASEKIVKEHYYNLLRYITDGLRAKREVKLPDFGFFYVRTRKARKIGALSLRGKGGSLENRSEMLPAKSEIGFRPVLAMKQYFRRYFDAMDQEL